MPDTQIWDANYRRFTAYIGPGFGQLELVIPAPEGSEYPHIARNVWDRNGLKDATLEPGATTVYLTVPDTMNPGTSTFGVEMRSPTDAVTLLNMAREVMGKAPDARAERMARPKYWYDGETLRSRNGGAEYPAHYLNEQPAYPAHPVEKTAALDVVILRLPVPGAEFGNGNKTAAIERDGQTLRLYYQDKDGILRVASYRAIDERR